MVSPAATTPELPSFEALVDAVRHAKPGEVVEFPIVSHLLYRLRWSLDGPLETSISVMADRCISPDLPPDEPYYQPDEPYYQPALSGNGAGSGGSWHPMSQDSLMDPKVSSIIINVGELDRWEDNWLQAHEGHYHPSYPLDPTQTRIGPLPGADPDDPTGG